MVKKWGDNFPQVTMVKNIEKNFKYPDNKNKGIVRFALLKEIRSSGHRLNHRLNVIPMGFRGKSAESRKHFLYFLGAINF